MLFTYIGAVSGQSWRVDSKLTSVGQSGTPSEIRSRLYLSHFDGHQTLLWKQATVLIVVLDCVFFFFFFVIYSKKIAQNTDFHCSNACGFEKMAPYIFVQVVSYFVTHFSLVTPLYFKWLSCIKQKRSLLPQIFMFFISHKYSTCPQK